jgi:Tripartite tricarboxylate transporter family receptor
MASTRTTSITACSAASGALAASTGTAPTGLCTLQADGKPCAHQIGFRRWKLLRRSSRRAGNSGKLGRCSKRCPNAWKPPRHRSLARCEQVAPAHVDTLNSEINAALADPKIKTRFADLGATVFSGSPADFGKLISDETEKWAKVVKFAGIKPD